MASDRTVVGLASVNREVAAPTARGQTTVEPIPAAAHEANRETEKVVTTVGGGGGGGDPWGDVGRRWRRWRRRRNRLCRGRRRQTLCTGGTHSTVGRTTRFIARVAIHTPNGRALNRKGEAQEDQN